MRFRPASIGVIAAALAVPAAFAGTSARPSIRPLSTLPLQVRGVHFKPHERVRVRVRSQGVNATKQVVVRVGGTFTATFAGVTIDRCLAFSLSAVGSFGDRAAWALKLPQPGCPPS